MAGMGCHCGEDRLRSAESSLGSVSRCVGIHHPLVDYAEGEMNSGRTFEQVAVTTEKKLGHTVSTAVDPFYWLLAKHYA